MSLKNKNILITGISGFVGSHMAKYLVDNGSKVYGLMRRRADGRIAQNIKGIKNEIKLIEGDMRDISSIALALDESTPDVIFHLASQSFVPMSFSNPLETMETNCAGTNNLLEAIRIKDFDPRIIFAGSSEEYGLAISSKEQYKKVKEKYGTIFPEPKEIPELPIDEKNPLRPMSPYAVSKVYSDYLMRNYYHSYGLKTIVSRAFNHEGAGRGIMFVTSAITSQIMKIKLNKTNKIMIGDVNVFRDWSHIKDILKGYCLLAEKGKYGDVYNQGSQRSNSILSYILLGLELIGYSVDKIETVDSKKTVVTPTEIDNSKIFGLNFKKTRVDKMMLESKLEFRLADRGIFVYTNKGKILIEFDVKRFRPAEVPILLSDAKKIGEFGFRIESEIQDIIRDQLNYFMGNIK